MPTKIEWCDETINPLGAWCFGRGGTKDKPNLCEYCYAARMAKRNMFECQKCNTFCEPHTHFERLDKLAQWKKSKTIFVQSMGDLFGEEVSNEWIKTVFQACTMYDQHRYLFLTKNPMRYIRLAERNELVLKNNFWYGYTAETVDRLFGNFLYDFRVRNIFISIEPIQEWFPEKLFRTPNIAKWVIVGAETGNRKDKVIPRDFWIHKIIQGCSDANIPLFMKDNLKKIYREPLIQQYPW